MTRLTAATITDDQIRWLRVGAIASGRLSLAARCDDALDRTHLSVREVRSARQECADAINRAEITIDSLEVQP